MTGIKFKNDRFLLQVMEMKKILILIMIMLLGLTGMHYK